MQTTLPNFARPGVNCAVPQVQSGTLHTLTVQREGFLEYLANILALLFLSGGLVSGLRPTEGYAVEVTDKDFLSFAVQFVVYISILPFLIRNRKILLEAAKQHTLIWILVVTAFFSTLWSDSPVNTLKHSILLFSTTLFGLYFGTRFGPGEQLRLLARALGLAAILSLGLAVLFPERGIMTWGNPGAWQGIFPHRNALARMMVLAAVVFLIRARDAKKPRFASWIGLAIATVLILFSESATGLALLTLFLLLAWLAPAVRWRRSRLSFAIVLALFAIAGFGSWLSENWTDVLASLGKNPTLTGRTYLWGMVILKALQRPWLGYGYNGFWLGLEGESAVIWKTMRWATPNAHNGFLDLWVSLGLIGLVTFLASYAITLLRSLKQARSERTAIGLWPLAFLLFYFLHNLVETSMVQHNTLLWVLYVTVSASTVLHTGARQGEWLANTNGWQRATNKQTEMILGRPAAARTKEDSIAASHRGDYPQQCES